MPMEKRSKNPVKALRVKEIFFPGEAECLSCPYCRTKSGLYGREELKRYENTICVLTYETLYSRDSEGKELLKGKGIGKYCPLVFPAGLKAPAEPTEATEPNEPNDLPTMKGE